MLTIEEPYTRSACVLAASDLNTVKLKTSYACHVKPKFAVQVAVQASSQIKAISQGSLAFTHGFAAVMSVSGIA